jgi:hypothetical protein
MLPESVEGLLGASFFHTDCVTVSLTVFRRFPLMAHPHHLIISITHSLDSGSVHLSTDLWSMLAVRSPHRAAFDKQRSLAMVFGSKVGAEVVVESPSMIKMTTFEKGVTIQGIRATFVKDRDIFGRQDPYLEFLLGEGYPLYTEMIRGGGTDVQWTEQVTLTPEAGDAEVLKVSTETLKN